jgi:hypothetical protein
MSKPPTLAELLASNKKQAVGPKCRVCVLLSMLKGNDLAMFEAALADVDQFSAAGLARAATGFGCTMGRSSVERHRRGDCATGT